MILKKNTFLTLEEINELNGNLLGKIEITGNHLFLTVTLRNNGNDLSRKQIVQGFNDFKALSDAVIVKMGVKMIEKEQRAKLKNQK